MSQAHDSEADGMKDSDRLLLAAYRDASTELPSAEVDDALRAAARRAVGARPQAPGRFRFGSWNTPLAAAATVVLSATVVFMAMREQGTDALSTPPVTSPAPSAQRDKGASMAPAEPPPAAAPVATPAPPVSSAAPVERTSIAAPGSGASAPSAETAPSMRVHDSPALQSAREPEVLTEPVTVDSRESLRFSAPQSTGVAEREGSEQRVQPAEKRRAESRPHGQTESLAVDDAAQSVGNVRVPQSQLRKSSPVAAQAPAPRVLPGSMADAEARRGEEEDADAKDAVDVAPGASAAAPQGMVKRLKESAEPHSPALEDLPRDAKGLSPAERTEHIRRLLRAGKRAEALNSLADLRRAYPDYSLPTDLLELSRSLPATPR